VCRFANGLRSLGVRKGDRVVVSMPLTIEGVVAMLACARIGAIHSVVYAGLGHAALRDRIQDAQARVVIAGDVGFRRGKTVQLKAIVDEALHGLDFVEHLVVYYRGGTESSGRRAIDFNALLEFPPECPAEEMDAEDPLFVLYTSGSTGRPKGVVHVHGGYMVATTYHLETFYDVGDRDLFWCTSDIGWIVGHSYIVYAPLCSGATTLFREGAIDYPDPGVAWAIVERYGVTKLFTAPTARWKRSSSGRYSCPGPRQVLRNITVSAPGRDDRPLRPFDRTPHVLDVLRPHGSDRGIVVALVDWWRRKRWRD
jgi:acetyl-CoA synthetase